MNETESDHLSSLRNEAAFLIQKTWRKHHLKKLSVAIGRIHELEAVLTKFVKADITAQFHDIKQELQKKNNLCAIIEKQNEELADRIVELEQQLLTKRQTKHIHDIDPQNADAKSESVQKMKCSMKELVMETNRLSELLNTTEHEKTSLKTSFIELSVNHKNDEKVIADLKHNLDKTVAKRTKLEFNNRALRLKLR
eukprot:769478_1